MNDPALHSLLSLLCLPPRRSLSYIRHLHSGAWMVGISCTHEERDPDGITLGQSTGGHGHADTLTDAIADAVASCEAAKDEEIARRMRIRKERRQAEAERQEAMKNIPDLTLDDLF